MKIKLFKIFSLLVLFLVTQAVVAEPQSCVPKGQWYNNDGNQVSLHQLLKTLGKNQVVLLGEDHDSAEHHRWQLQVMNQLYALKPNMVIGFEAFPRKVQPILDQWINGELSEEDFLAKVDWATIWSYNAAHYMPMFHFARMNRIPMLALNVERNLVSKVGANGWENIPEAEREGVSRPAMPSEDYLDMLAEVFGQHMTSSHGGNSNHTSATDHTSAESSDTEASAPKVDKKNPAFIRFVEGQTLWDRAMAEAILQGKKKYNVDVIIGVMGSGHVMGGFGVPHQLADLGIKKVKALMPWDQRMQCDQLQAGVADYFFGLVHEEAENNNSKKPRLGVYLEPTNDLVRIKTLVSGSIAEKSGLQQDDKIVTIAGRNTKTVGEIVEAVQRTAFGTWLPIKILRNGKEVEIIAKFPANDS